MSDWMIELDDITKRYGELVANDHVTLRIRRGELMTLLGPSGCGKTTALRCITGQNIPDAGRVLIDGKDVTDVPTHRRELGMVFQNFALFPHMTVFGNVEFPLMIRGTGKAQRAEMVMEVLKLIRLEVYARHYPRQLSGGQQQRVGLARALVYRPKVLLLDEPLSNLDAKLREEMRFEIRDLQRRLGITAVYVTHDQEEALALSDRVAVMNKGRVQQVGTPAEIYAQPATKFVADFIGLSDFIPARVAALEGRHVVLAINAERISVPAVQGLQAGQDVLLFIRPNDVQIRPAAERRENCLLGTIAKSTYLGDKFDYRVAIDGMEVRVQTHGTDRFEIGQQVAIHLPCERCSIILESGVCPAT
ncbi:MAG TPA: ABC transporter ATP-binding protein [Anaerolineae bacterium]|nr:ABC transporter ATP-binding protein [Anaerolineae bacterium]